MKYILKYCFIFIISLISLNYITRVTLKAYFNIWNLEKELLPYAIHNNQVYIFNKDIYSFGGSSNIVSNKLFIGKLGLDDSILNWRISDSTLPFELLWHNLAYLNQNVYILGGSIFPNYQPYSINNVSLGHIDNSDILHWIQVNPLPAPLSLGSSHTFNGYIYYSGGGFWNGSNYDFPKLSNKVYKALVNIDGVLGDWQDAGFLPEPLLGHEMTFIGEKIYIFGGIRNICNLPTTECYPTTGNVWVSSLDSKGNISSWEKVSELGGGPSYQFMLINSGNYLIKLGGRGNILHGSILTDNIFFSEIASNGSIGPWKESNYTLPLKLCCSGVALSENSIFLFGGHDGKTYFNNVWRAKIADIVSEPTPTPTPKITKPLVFIPGMGGSLNMNAFLYNQDLDHSYWKLVSYVSPYDGLIKTFKKAGYEMNKTLFIYTYDWRKDIKELTVDFQQYIRDHVLTGKPDGTQIDVVGHCMGGLIARSAAKDAYATYIDKVITAGSPVLGSATVYPVWEGAELSDMPDMQRIAIQILLRIHQKDYDDQVTEIQDMIPSIQNFLPVWSYLQTKNGQTKDLSKLTWQNNFLGELNGNSNNMVGRMSILYGSGYNTPETIKVAEPERIQKLLGKWIDGQPTGKIYSDGDDTVTTSSAHLAGVTQISEITNTNHGEIVSAIPGQMEIMRYLGVKDAVATENNNTDAQKSLAVFVGSPVTFTVENGEKTWNPKDGLVVITNPENGNYKIHVTSILPGEYTLYFGRLFKGDTAWEEETGNFTAGEPTEREYIYNVNFDNKNLGGNPLEDAIERMQIITDTLSKAENTQVYSQAAKVYMTHIQQDLNNLKSLNTNNPEAGINSILKQINFSLTNLHTWKIVPEKFDFGSAFITQQMRLVKGDMDQYAGDIL